MINELINVTIMTIILRHKDVSILIYQPTQLITPSKALLRIKLRHIPKIHITIQRLLILIKQTILLLIIKLILTIIYTLLLFTITLKNRFFTISLLQRPHFCML